MWANSLNTNMAYIFNTTLLSAILCGNPPPTNTSLSANGITLTSLGSAYKGVSFQSTSALLLTSTQVTIDNTVLQVDWSYAGSTFALVNLPVNNVQFYSIFPISNYATLSASATLTLATSSLSTSTDVFDPERRRKWLYGYV